MPITITDVSLNFRKVCEYAKKKQKTELAILVETTIKTVNFVFGLERPIEQLAYAGEDDAVEFLLLEFNGDFASAVRGYARANNSSAVERLIRSGADINHAVMGYAIAGNIAAVNDLLCRGADKSLAIRGYAQAGNVNIVDSMLIADSDDSDFENSPWLQDALLGYACGDHVAAVDNLFQKLQRHQRASGATIVQGYAWINNQNELARWRDLDVVNLYSEEAMDGYANGGHFTELAALSRNAMPNQVFALIGRLENLSSSEHILQVNEIINASMALGYPIFNLIHRIFAGYAKAGNFEEINKLCAQFNLDNSDVIKAHVNNMNYYMLQKIYEQNNAVETLNEIKKAVWQQDPHFFPDMFQICTDTILFILTSITNDILRKAIIDTIFNEVTRPNIYDKAKKISDSMQKGLCYEEAKQGKLSHFMDNYHFNANQARMFVSKEINVFIFFLQIVPAITKKLTDHNLIWLIASYLLPKTWDAKLLADNKRLYSQSIMQPNDMLDLSIKISAYRMFKLPFVVKNSDKICKNTHSEASCTFLEEASTSFNVTANSNIKRQKR